ncbi:MAG: hypothetical protein JNJ59_26390, partial [Deltaproteobacteria bacterium]|nr:hypothetical protein [Deltaproteobacteria bacterium]
MVDLLAATRRMDPRAARRIACDLAGLGGRQGRPPSAPRAPDTTRRPTHVDVIDDLADLGLDGAERDARVWAIGVAAYHYRVLAGFDPVPDDPDDVHDWPAPRDHVEYVADVAGRPRTWRHDLLGARAVAIEYLNARLGEAAADVAPYLAELVGVCPTA